MAKSTTQTRRKSTSSRTPQGRVKPPMKKQKLAKYESEEEESSNDEDADEYQVQESSEEAESEPETLKSDDLDDDDTPSSKKRKRSSPTKQSQKKQASSPRKRGVAKGAAKKRKVANNDEDAFSDVSVEEGQEIVGRIVQAPKEGRVPPGRISQNTFNFLGQLADPECNDREWFKLHEPVYRLAEKEWVDFIDTLVPKIAEVDDQLPHLPAKDVIHRIYRDIRFSNDKTPYKTNFSASMSRSGRKGVFAGYHVSSKSFLINAQYHDVTNLNISQYAPEIRVLLEPGLGALERMNLLQSGKQIFSV
ncbi:hypothetical protein FRC03_007169 [Tulasnella sp. 419]|nr:hypothetical protein FRC03_007169 [Tulasnella sp. 419]